MNFYDKLYDVSGVNYGQVDTTNLSLYSEREKKLRSRLLRLIYLYAVPLSSNTLEIGASTGGMSNLLNQWTGVEYSAVAIEIAKKRFDDQINIVEGDAQCMHFLDTQFDLVFSWATLEHVVDPNKAFCEIDRVLKKQGIAILKPAWNCRSWTVNKIKMRPYKSLSILESLKKFCLPIISNYYFRAIYMLPIRTSKLLKSSRSKNVKLKYSKLYPNQQLIKEYGHEADDDAFSSFDIVDAIIFFQSRGYKILSHRSLFSKIFSRGVVLVVKKLN